MRRLVAVLAWYALIPPVVGGQVAPGAPLAQGAQIRAVDRAEECEKMMLAYAQQAAAQTDNADRARARQVQYVRCISASDPRLKS